MSDEIDIEEHDLMDNPTIKRIFPDLSVIKKEINQYYDEDLPDKLPETTFQELSQEQEKNMSISTVQLQSQKQINSEFNSASPCNVSEVTEIEKEELRYLHNNIIILGSKPNLGFQTKNNNSLRIGVPKLILQNISSFLNGSKRYCKECLILFPKPNIYNLHMYNVHTKQVSVLTQQSNKVGKKISNKLYKCNTCKKIISSKGNLIRHFKNLHGNTKNMKRLISEKKVDSCKASNNTITPGLPCFHCQQLFPTQSSLIEHLYEVLEPRKIEPKSCSTSSTSTKDATIMNNFNDQLLSNDVPKKNLHNNENTSCALETPYLDKFDQHNSELNYKPKLNTDKSNTENILPPKTELLNNSLGTLTTHEKKTFNKKKLKAHTNDSLRLKTKKCDKCTERFKYENELQYHIMSVHSKNVHINKNKVKTKMTEERKEHNEITKTSTKPLFYKCFICSKYNMTFKFYSRHIINDHNIKETVEVKKVPFDSKCKFCSSIMSDMKSYNTHLYKYHPKLLKKADIPHEEKVAERCEKFNKETCLASKSVLFKCMKCFDLFFLSCNAAMNHKEHLEIINNWKCSVCQRIFRQEDMALHLKQHSFTKKITVHALSESGFSCVLYKCSNCTVHYSEENFFIHYTKCKSETPNSLYCKVCDILINRDDRDFHELNHAKNMQCSDFTIIESDMIDNRRPKKVRTKQGGLNINDESSNILEENSKYVMHFCHTCKCYINNIKLTRNVHIEAKCGHMLRTICKDCGLALTTKTHATHKQHHKKEQIKLQDYIFFDLESRKQICPPVPEYPNCKMCGVHFLRNCTIRFHECHEQDYLTCNICSIKLTEHAYKVHMPFHNYMIQNVDIKLKDPSEVDLKPINNISTNSYASGNSNFVDDFTFYFTCKSCQITVNTYDKVVQHCQDHYDFKEITINTQKCQNCIFIFGRSDYENHKKLHLNGTYNKDSITVVDFDPFYFRFDNSFWTKHIFAYVADHQSRKILDTSMYRYECRLKMEEQQSGSSNLILYKCEKCQVFIEPYSLYMHAKNSSDRSCVELRKHPCSFCGLCFISLNYRIAHEKEHKGIDINLKSYKIILFNKMEHETFNKVMYDACNRYILYQCRNCETVVDKFQRKEHKCDTNNLKMCFTCGLLLHRKDYDLHFIRHEELEKFNTTSIIVVMFGKLCYLGKRKLRSTFAGTKYDYTIYKCKNCDLCLRTKICTRKHNCDFDNSKCKCSKCGMYFSKQELIHHSKLHEGNLEFDEFNVNIITFDKAPKINIDAKQTAEHNNDSVKSTEVIKEQPSPVIENTDKLERIYKCECGLHFLEELNAQQHANNCNVKMKISKQSCFKCDLLFTPGELFNHLLKHHCDKKLQYKFDVIVVSKKENEATKT